MKKSILRLALFASASMMVASATPAFAQCGGDAVDENGNCLPSEGSEKPESYSDQICTAQAEYQLVLDGSPGPWRLTDNIDYYTYDESAPVKTCGPVSRITPMKCVNAATKAAVEPENCDNSSTMTNIFIQYPNMQVTKEQKVYPGPINWIAAERKDLGACGFDQYEWNEYSDDYGLCGTATVDISADCRDKDTGYGVDESKCNPSTKPTGQKEVTSTRGCTFDYSVGAVTLPAPSCGAAQKTRAVTCQGGDGKAAGEGDCENFFLNGYDYTDVDYGKSAPFEHVYIKGHPSACEGLTGAALYAECELVGTPGGYYNRYLRPRTIIDFDDARSCQTAGDENYEWRSGAYTPVLDKVCGTNTRTASAECYDKTSNARVDDNLCNPATKPSPSQTFNDVSGCVPQTAGGTCGDAPSSSDQSQFSSCLSRVGIGGADKPWAVNLTRAITLTDGAKVFCVQSAGPTGGEFQQPDHQLCDPTDWDGGDMVSNDPRPTSYIALEGTGVCAGSNLPSCIAPPPPPPTPDPTPIGPPKEFRLGTCNYTSGSSKYACGQRSNYRPGQPAPYPHDICSGTILSGSESSDMVGIPPNQTDNVGPGWVKPPNPLINVPGAQCVVHFRSYGYSNSVQEGWQTVYFSGPPTGVADGLFIGPKP